MKKILKTITISILLLAIGTTVFADPYSPYRNRYIEGYIKSISKDQITIEEYDGTNHTIRFIRNAVLKIDGILVSPLDFKVGMEVYGELKGRSLKYLEGFSTENPGYIPPGKKVRAGVVKSITLDSITIKLPAGRDETYNISPATLIQKKGEISHLSRVYEGDRVRLYFDEYNSNMVSRMAIEGDSILVKGLYKGTLSYSDDLEDEIVLKDVKVFKNTSWDDYNKMTKISYNGDSPIYIGGQKIKNQNLKYYKGKDIYVAVNDFFGSDRIEKMVIKNAYEKTYDDKIIDINWYSEGFELNNRVNFSLNDGTIVLKNGRLVDKYSINPDSDAFVIGDGNKNVQANVVYIYNEDINNSPAGEDYIYFGRLDEVIDNKLLLRNYSVLNKNSWDFYKGTDEFYFDDDTHIYDIEKKKKVTTKEFQSGNYAVDENSEYAKGKKLKDWYGYLYTNGDRIAVVGAKKDKDDLLRQRITLGTISRLEQDPHVGQVMYLRDSRDWSNRNESWMAKSTDLRLMIGDALIVKDDKLISWNELKAGDRLYLIRDDFRCKFILVK